MLAPVRLERAIVGEMPVGPKAAPTSLPILYWRDPDGTPSYSAKPKTTDDGREFVPVHEDGAGPASAAVAAAPTRGC